MIKRLGYILGSKILLIFSLVLYSGVASHFVQAEIVSSDANNFDLKFKVEIKASQDKLKSTFENISSWWHPDHTYSGDSNNLYLDLKSEHCFCEKLASGGSVRHMDWVFYQPNKKARFVGGLGPLQSLPVDGVLEFNFKALDKDKMELSVSYSVASSGDRLN
ncbi:MAG: hypothetical protein OQJ89_11800, partial [Kangiellaceae bacterium]|nr:hypothetical protein [Kangiellaceae bacterium]